MTAIALTDPERLYEAVAGSDVAIILAGHNHHASSGMLGAIPVWVGPAVSYRADVLDENEFKASSAALSPAST